MPEFDPARVSLFPSCSICGNSPAFALQFPNLSLIPQRNKTVSFSSSGRIVAKGSRFPLLFSPISFQPYLGFRKLAICIQNSAHQLFFTSFSFCRRNFFQNYLSHIAYALVHYARCLNSIVFFFNLCSPPLRPQNQKSNTNKAEQRDCVCDASFPQCGE